MHWEFDAERGLYHLPPYDDRNVASKHLTVFETSMARAAFSRPCGVRPAIADKYLPTAMLQHRERYQRPEWAQTGLFGKPDVVPLVDQASARSAQFADDPPTPRL